MSIIQISALMDFLERQPELATGRTSRSSRTKEGRSLLKRLWQECAAILNSVSSDCIQKTPEQWRMFFNDYKFKMLKKMKSEKAENLATGGGGLPITMLLTPLQERLYNILERDVGELLPGVRHNPLTQTVYEGSENVQTNSDDNLEISDGDRYLKVELEEGRPSTESHTERQCRSVMNQNDTQPEDVPAGSRTDRQCSSAAGMEPAEHSQSQHSRQHVPRQRVPWQRIPRQGVPRQRVPQQRVPRQRVPRRRPRPRRDETIESEEDSLRSTRTLLYEMENQGARAMLVHAQATNRLAAAIEYLASVIANPNDGSRLASPTTTSRSRVVVDSEESD